MFKKWEVYICMFSLKLIFVTVLLCICNISFLYAQDVRIQPYKIKTNQYPYKGFNCNITIQDGYSYISSNGVLQIKDSSSIIDIDENRMILSKFPNLFFVDKSENALLQIKFPSLLPKRMKQSEEIDYNIYDFFYCDLCDIDTLRIDKIISETNGRASHDTLSSFNIPVFSVYKKTDVQRLLVVGAIPVLEIRWFVSCSNSYTDYDYYGIKLINMTDLSCVLDDIYCVKEYFKGRLESHVERSVTIEKDCIYISKTKFFHSEAYDSERTNNRKEYVEDYTYKNGILPRRVPGKYVYDMEKNCFLKDSL